ncbi:hypothetical protein AQUCO_02000421v1 [Aquilegia coerulea]|uniref:F-box domain-containing protein n=1 Tax=Aquilegia coerulea TaxID=218851 RepID=A0A2G5DIA1_AQUCA|nr:hypothetical protein AQUCO_02000421v1 [Aquilegia coerulea]
MRRHKNLKIRALEDRRKQNFITTKTNPDYKQKKKVTQEYVNRSKYPIERLFNNGFQPKFYEEYDNFCNPICYEDCEEIFDSFNYVDSSYSESFFDDEDCEDEENLQGFEDVDIEALEEEGDETSGVMLKLPLDIFLDILSRQPIRSLARCRCVCKTWRKIVHHPRFTSMHIDKAIQLNSNYDCNSSVSLVLHSTIYEAAFGNDIYCLEHDMGDNPDNAMIVKPRFAPSNFEFQVVGSCNGLLCLSENLYYDPIYVCNPAIGEYVKIPEISKRTHYDIVSGFGYDEVAKEYKVIRMMFDSIDYVSEGNSSFKLEAEIYTLGSGVWRKMGDVSYPLRGRASSAFVNGALHWLTDEFIGLSVSERIISFDVSREEFHAIPPPPGFDYVSETFHFSLCDLRKSLCLLDYSSNDQFEIWVMKKYGVKTSWTKEYIISRQELGMDKFYLDPLKLLPNGEMLLVYNSESLVCYDPEQRTVRELGIHNLPPRFEAFTHVGSFVSLSDIIGPSTSRRSVNNRKWYRALRPLYSHNPEVDIDDCILDYEVQQLAALLDSGVRLSDLYPDW